jgi:hypothetical protein
MVGICTTLIGLVKIIEVRTGSRHVDEYGGLAALFLVSALASYLAIRLSSQGRVSAWCERIADLFFVAGLVSLTLISLLFAYEAIKRGEPFKVRSAVTAPDQTGYGHHLRVIPGPFAPHRPGTLLRRPGSGRFSFAHLRPQPINGRVRACAARDYALGSRPSPQLLA